MVQCPWGQRLYACVCVCRVKVCVVCVCNSVCTTARGFYFFISSISYSSGCCCCWPFVIMISSVVLLRNNHSSLWSAVVELHYHYKECMVFSVWGVCVCVLLLLSGLTFRFYFSPLCLLISWTCCSCLLLRCLCFFFLFFFCLFIIVISLGFAPSRSGRQAHGRWCTASPGTRLPCCLFPLSLDSSFFPVSHSPVRKLQLFTARYVCLGMSLRASFSSVGSGWLF